LTDRSERGERRRRWTLVSAAALSFMAAPARASEGGSGGLMSFDEQAFVWTLLTFVIMLVLLGRFAWKPLLGALDAREKGIEGTLAEARRQREEAAALLQQHEQLLVAARRERAEAMEQGRKQAESIRAEILEEARRQREQVLGETRAQVQAEMRAARAELRSAAVDLSIAAAGKLLARNLDDSAQRRLVEEHLAELERSGGRGAPS
jgi:F-type H+-transporting ATPase subunit b